MEVFRLILVVTGEFYNTFSRELWVAEETECHIAVSQISELFAPFILHSIPYPSLLRFRITKSFLTPATSVTELFLLVRLCIHSL